MHPLVGLKGHGSAQMGRPVARGPVRGIEALIRPLGSARPTTRILPGCSCGLDEGNRRHWRTRATGFQSGQNQQLTVPLRTEKSPLVLTCRIAKRMEAGESGANLRGGAPWGWDQKQVETRMGGSRKPVRFRRIELPNSEGLGKCVGEPGRRVGGTHAICLPVECRCGCDCGGKFDTAGWRKGQSEQNADQGRVHGAIGCPS